MNAVINDDSRKHTTEVHVVPSRYALSLQKKNRKRSSGYVNKRGKLVPGVKVISHRASSALVTDITPPAAPIIRKFEGQIKTANLFARKTNFSMSSVLHSTPRPTLPTRISLQNMKRNTRPIKAEEGLREWGTTHSSSSVNRIKDACTECDVQSSFKNKSQSEGEELEVLQSLYYQLCFVEAKAEDTFRRQEQQAEAQMMVSWDILQSKLQKLQTTLLHLDGQGELEMIENQITNLAEPTVQLAHQLPHARDSISQLYIFVKIALSRLSCSGISYTNPLQLRQHMETLMSELDNLQEQIETAHISNFASSTNSVENVMQQLTSKSTEAQPLISEPSPKEN